MRPEKMSEQTLIFTPLYPDDTAKTARDVRRFLTFIDLAVALRKSRKCEAWKGEFTLYVKDSEDYCLFDEGENCFTVENAIGGSLALRNFLHAENAIETPFGLLTLTAYPDGR